MQEEPRVAKPCETDFEVRIPKGQADITVTISSYDGPDLSGDPKREVCTLDVDGDENAFAFLRVYLLPEEMNREIFIIKVDRYDAKKETRIENTISGPNNIYVQAKINKGDPPIAVG